MKEETEILQQPAPKPSSDATVAAATGDLDALKKALTAMPDAVNKPDSGGLPPIAYALANGQMKTAVYLVNNGAQPVLEFPPDFKASPWAIKFFRDQIGYRARGDWDGLMRDFYNDDCVMISFDFALYGKEAIKQHFIDGNKAAGKLIGFSVANYNEGKDLIIMRSTVLSEFVLTKAHDTYLFRDGKLSLYSALTVSPRQTREWATKWAFEEYLDATIYNALGPFKASHPEQ